MKRERIKINDVEDYNSICDDLLTEWIEDFTERKGLTRDPEEDDYYAFDLPKDELMWMYTQKGMKLYYSACSKLKKLGEKYFDSGLDIKSSAVLFP